MLAIVKFLILKISLFNVKMKWQELKYFYIDTMKISKLYIDWLIKFCFYNCKNEDSFTLNPGIINLDLK